MIIDTMKTIAYKCSSCGSFEFNSISFFSLLNKKENKYYCRCKKSFIVIKKEGDGGFLIITPCMGCGNEHAYFITRKDAFFKDIRIFNCPETGMQQCFFGNDMSVRQKVDSLEAELDKLMDTLGYDSYFRNTQVMLDSLNKIHDIAASGYLFCECGNNNIELILLSDRILLKCPVCNAGKLVKAATNEDLKELMQKQGVVVTSEDNEYTGNKQLGK